MIVAVVIVVVMVILFIFLALLMYGAGDRTDSGMKRKDAEQMQALGINESDED